jgi:hypothetical protein
MPRNVNYISEEDIDPNPARADYARYDDNGKLLP